jgi:hypothetical protein
MSKIVPVKQINLFRSIDQLAKDGDHISERHHELTNLRRIVRQQRAALENGEPMTEIIDGKQAALSKYDETVLARFDELSELLDPPENYEDNDRDEGDLRRSVVSVRLASMIGAFPNANPTDPEVYVGLLLEHVCAEKGINLLTLDTACRKIVATQKFVPTVSEIIAVLGEQQQKWNDRLWSFSSMAETSRWAVTEIAELRVEAEEAAKKRAVETAQRDLKWVLHQRGKAIADACAAQTQAAIAAQAVASKLASLAQCSAEVLEKEKALAEAVKRNTGTAKAAS